MSHVRKSVDAARVGIALWAAALAVAFGIGGLGASGASAAPTCSGANLIGEGSSSQRIGQVGLWRLEFEKTCPEVDVDFNGNGDGGGLDAWNFNGPDLFRLDHTRGFVASDQAPTVTQIENAEAAAGGASPVLVIPVAQTSIAIVVHPPVGCNVTRITNKQLEAVFSGSIKTWGKIDTATGEGCAAAPITRVVRPDGSGVTAQFKEYLSLINSEPVPCTEEGTNWTSLAAFGLETEPDSESAEPNTTWPESGVAGCSETELSRVITASVDGDMPLVKKVNKTSGSIGYAVLPAVEQGKTSETTHTLQLQNNGLVKLANAVYAEPGTEAAAANCEATVYIVPAAGRVGTGTGESVDWTPVAGAKTNIGGEAYPLCMLTYDFAFKDYSNAGFSEATELSVHDYLTEYVVTEGGQLELQASGKYYAELPGGAAANNVLGAAQLAASLIGY